MTGCVTLRKNVYYIRLTYYDKNHNRKDKWVTTGLSVITGIALDHTAYLGDTLGKIATEKAGIIKPKVPVVFGGESIEAYEAISVVAKKKESVLYTASRAELSNIVFSLRGCTFNSPDFKELFVSLVGEYQPSNIATALKCISVLRGIGYKLTEKIIREGMAEVYWPARFEIINEDPLMIYDGAHNPEGLRACVDSIKHFFGEKKVNIISGVMADKDVGSMLPL